MNAQTPSHISHPSRSGYTLLEMLLVIAIMFILMQVVMVHTRQLFYAHAQLHSHVDHMQLTQRFSNQFREDIYQADDVQLDTPEAQPSAHLTLTHGTDKIVYSITGDLVTRRESEAAATKRSVEEFKFPLQSNLHFMMDSKTNVVRFQSQLNLEKIVSINHHQNKTSTPVDYEILAIPMSHNKAKPPVEPQGENP
jgi:prepilin-type N-terminal cleavage/methylation domain-containing protein